MRPRCQRRVVGSCRSRGVVAMNAQALVIESARDAERARLNSSFRRKCWLLIVTTGAQLVTCIVVFWELLK